MASSTRARKYIRIDSHRSLALFTETFNWWILSASRGCWLDGEIAERLETSSRTCDSTSNCVTDMTDEASFRIAGVWNSRSGVDGSDAKESVG